MKPKWRHLVINGRGETEDRSKYVSASFTPEKWERPGSPFDLLLKTDALWVFTRKPEQRAYVPVSIYYREKP